MAGKTEVLGIGELRTQFARLKDIDRGARRIAVAGGRVLRKIAKQNAEAQGLRRTGSLINNIVIKRERTPSGISEYHLGVRHGQALTKRTKEATRYLAVNSRGRIVTRYRDDPYYWKFHEFGYVNTGGYRIRGGKRRRDKTRAELVASGRGKQVPARPFIGPALEQGKGQAIEAMQKQALKEIERQAKP